MEKLSLGQTTSVPLLGPADFTGSGGTVLRDLAVHSDGTIFTLYTSGVVDQFTPNGGGGYVRATVGTYTGFTSGDRGSGHQLSISLNGQYLLTSSRTPESHLVAVDLERGRSSSGIRRPDCSGPLRARS